MFTPPLSLSCKEHSALKSCFRILFLFTIFHPLCRHLPVLPDEKRTEIADDFTEIFDKGAISTSKRLLYSDAKCSPK